MCFSRKPKWAKKVFKLGKRQPEALVRSFAMEQDLESKTPTFTAGFRENGKFVGFVWQKSYYSLGGNSLESRFGIINPDTPVSQFGRQKDILNLLDWLPKDAPVDASAFVYDADRYFDTKGLASSPYYPAVILIEEPEEDKRKDGYEVFCGMHCGGVKNGLGSLFFFSGTEKPVRMAELQGLWLNGELAYIRSGEKLIPVNGAIAPEDAPALQDIYRHIAHACGPRASRDYFEKAAKMGELIPVHTRETLLIQADIYKSLGREDEYVELLCRVMDTYGNDASLSWTLYEFLEGKGDPSKADALRRYLDSPEGEPEKRLIAIRALGLKDMEEDAFLDTFTFDIWRNEYTMDHGDFDCLCTLDVQGFMKDKHFYGYAWLDRYNTGHPLAGDPVRTFRCGILKDEYEKDYGLDCHAPTLDYGLYYDISENTIRIDGDPRPEILIEKDSEGRITFCGMQRDGIRHGLGTEFTYVDGKLKLPLKGYWKNGVLTHKVDGLKLVKI